MMKWHKETREIREKKEKARKSELVKWAEVEAQNCKSTTEDFLVCRSKVK